MPSAGGYPTSYRTPYRSQSGIGFADIFPPTKGSQNLSVPGATGSRVITDHASQAMNRALRRSLMMGMKLNPYARLFNLGLELWDWYASGQRVEPGPNFVLAAQRAGVSSELLTVAAASWFGGNNWDDTSIWSVLQQFQLTVSQSATAQWVYGYGSPLPLGQSARGAAAWQRVSPGPGPEMVPANSFPLPNWQAPPYRPQLLAKPLPPTAPLPPPSPTPYAWLPLVTPSTWPQGTTFGYQVGGSGVRGGPRLGVAYRRPPGRREKEKKLLVTKGMLGALTKVYTEFSEVFDFVDALYDALPKHLQTVRYQKSAFDAEARKAAEVWKHLDQVDAAKAMNNIINNAIEDGIIGGALKKGGEARRALSPTGVGSGVGLDRSLFNPIGR